MVMGDINEDGKINQVLEYCVCVLSHSVMSDCLQPHGL